SADPSEPPSSPPSVCSRVRACGRGLGCRLNDGDACAASQKRAIPVRPRASVTTWTTGTGREGRTNGTGAMTQAKETNDTPARRRRIEHTDRSPAELRALQAAL